MRRHSSSRAALAVTACLILLAGGRYAFLLAVGVRRPSCVPLLVTRNGGRTHRRVVSLGAGRCA